MWQRLSYRVYHLPSLSWNGNWNEYQFFEFLPTSPCLSFLNSSRYLFSLSVFLCKTDYIFLILTKLGVRSSCQLISVTPGKVLMFKKTENRGIEGYVNADWAGSREDSRSTTWYCTKVWGNVVIWRRKKQSIVARSSVEAEFRAIAHGICDGWKG